MLVLGVAGLISGWFIWRHYETRAEAFDLSRMAEMPERSLVYDVRGEEIGRLHGENRLPVALGEISEHFIKALLAREDARFWKHKGVDLAGVARALVVNLISGEVRQGASTITQQLARNTYPLGGQTLDRKLLEAALALRIERAATKEEILEWYCNRIYFGSGQLGVEAASRAYFGKRAKDLELGEAAMLAGLIRSPSRLNPWANSNAAKRERDIVLQRMVDGGVISIAEREAAQSAELVVRSRESTQREGWAMDVVRRELDLILGDDFQSQGGLRIMTTIDNRLQRAAERALDDHLTSVEAAPGWIHPRKSDFTERQIANEEQTRYLQGAVLVLDNRTGGVRAVVGGRDYQHSKLNRAWTSRRQVGSAFKPFIYAAAYEAGMFPGMLISDGRIQPGEVKGASGWNPGNADGKFTGDHPAETGLIRSRNTMSVRVGEFAGLESVARIGERAGVAAVIPRHPSLYLGAFETTPKELTWAFTAFPNAGMRRPITLIQRVESGDGELIFAGSEGAVPVMEQGSAWLVLDGLQKVMKRGTAARARAIGWDKPSGGKTGTTNDFRDAWFVGFTQTLTCGVWVGLDEPKPIMNRGYGSTLALPIWVETMKAADEAFYPTEPFEPLVALQRVSLCAVTNQLATRRCGEMAYEMDVPETMVPARECEMRHGVMEADEKRRPGLLQRLFPWRRRNVPEEVRPSVEGIEEEMGLD
ncbi:MAG: PBP1A family penicillin-binding protein [Verrucomicrobiia bacterium]